MAMHSIKVMDSSGDRSISWRTEDPQSLLEAQQVFDDLKKKGQVFRAQPNGEGGGVMREFEPHADMIATPVIVGG